MKLNKRFFYGVLTAVALLAAGCSKDNTDPVPDPGTGEQLVENPKVRAAVRTMMSEAARTESTLNGVAVWQEGYASSGEWPKGSDNDTRRQMWSVTKTFTSMAVGIAVGTCAKLLLASVKFVKEPAVEFLYGIILRGGDT